MGAFWVQILAASKFYEPQNFTKDLAYDDDVNQGFSTSALLTLCADNSLMWGGCPVRCKVVSSIPGLHSRDANSNPFSVLTTENISKQYQISLVVFLGLGGGGGGKTTGLD